MEMNLQDLVLIKGNKIEKRKFSPNNGIFF